jgi:nuclear RNA export factor
MDAPAGGRGRGGFRARRGGGGRPININNAPKGPAADREKASGSGSGVTRSRGSSRRDPAGTRSRGDSSRKTGSTTSSGPVVGVRVQGWKESKGSAEECVRFLERKTNLKFRKV